MQQTVLITGGTGLIGQALTSQLLEKGYRIIVLTRYAQKKKNTENIRYSSWDIHKQTIDIPAVQAADFIIHLAGAGVVDKRWTAAYKKEILESRTLGSKLLTDTLNNHPNKVKAIISASAIGWYGADKEKNKYFTETDPHANDFLAKLCVLWEQSISVATKTNIRICKLRTGIVFSNEGGALKEFKKPIRFGVAAILSSGKQMISWIHIDDLCRMYIYAMENEAMTGSYNAVSDDPVSNKEFTIKLAEALRGKFIIPVHVPSPALKLVLGESSIEVLKSTSVSNMKIKSAGFKFIYPSIKTAIAALTAKKL